MASNHSFLPQHLFASAHQPFPQPTQDSQNPPLFSWQPTQNPVAPLPQTQPENIFFFEIPTSFGSVLQPQTQPYQLFPAQLPSSSKQPQAAVAPPPTSLSQFSNLPAPTQQQGMMVQAQAQIQVTPIPQTVHDQSTAAMLSYLLQQGYTLIPQQPQNSIAQPQLQYLPPIQQPQQQIQLPAAQPSSTSWSTVQPQPAATRQPQHAVQLRSLPPAASTLPRPQQALPAIARPPQLTAMPQAPSWSTVQQQPALSRQPQPAVQPQSIPSSTLYEQLQQHRVFPQQSQGTPSLVDLEKQQLLLEDLIRRSTAAQRTATVSTKPLQAASLPTIQHPTALPTNQFLTPVSFLAQPRLEPVSSQKQQLHQPAMFNSTLLTPKPMSDAAIIDALRPQVQQRQFRALVPSSDASKSLPGTLPIGLNGLASHQQLLPHFAQPQHSKQLASPFSHRLQMLPPLMNTTVVQSPTTFLSPQLDKTSSVGFPTPPQSRPLKEPQVEYLSLEEARKREERNAYHRAYYRKKKAEKGEVVTRAHLTPEEKKARQAASYKSWRDRNYVRFIKEVAPPASMRAESRRLPGHLNIKAEPVDDVSQPIDEQAREVQLETRLDPVDFAEQQQQIAAQIETRDSQHDQQVSKCLLQQPLHHAHASSNEDAPNPVIPATMISVPPSAIVLNYQFQPAIPSPLPTPTEIRIPTPQLTLFLNEAREGPSVSTLVQPSNDQLESQAREEVQDDVCEPTTQVIQYAHQPSPQPLSQASIEPAPMTPVIVTKQEKAKEAARTYYERKKLERGLGPVRKKVLLTEEEKRARRNAACRAWREKNYVKFVGEFPSSRAISKKNKGGASTMIRRLLNIKSEPVDDYEDEQDEAHQSMNDNFIHNIVPSEETVDQTMSFSEDPSIDVTFDADSETAPISDETDRRENVESHRIEESLLASRIDDENSDADVSNSNSPADSTYSIEF